MAKETRYGKNVVCMKPVVNVNDYKVVLHKLYAISHYSSCMVINCSYIYRAMM